MKMSFLVQNIFLHLPSGFPRLLQKAKINEFLAVKGYQQVLSLRLIAYCNNSSRGDSIKSYGVTPEHKEKWE